MGGSDTSQQCDSPRTEAWQRLLVRVSYVGEAHVCLFRSVAALVADSFNSHWYNGWNNEDYRLTTCW